jgi:integrase
VTIKKAPRKLFPEMTDAELQRIEACCLEYPEPLKTQFHNSFLVARYHGVRLNETNVNPMRDVRFWMEGEVKRAAVTFHQKGGKVKSKPLHPALFELFEKLQSRKATHTYPPLKWGSRWFNFFERHGFKAANPNLCFHSLRVTVKSRLRRHGISKELAMEYLSHEAADVDESYNRFTLDDLQACHAALK